MGQPSSGWLVSVMPAWTQVKVLILLVTQHLADLGCCPASHRFVRRVFSPICHFPQRPAVAGAVGCLQLIMYARTRLSRRVIAALSPRPRRARLPAESAQLQLEPILMVGGTQSGSRSALPRSGPLRTVRATRRGTRLRQAARASRAEVRVSRSGGRGVPAGRMRAPGESGHRRRGRAARGGRGSWPLSPCG